MISGQDDSGAHPVSAPDKAHKSPQLPESLRMDTRLGEVGISGYAPYLMNRILGQYNASLRSGICGEALTVPKVRVLAVLSVIDGPLIRDLADYAVIEQSTLSRSLDQLVAGGLVRRVQDSRDSRGVRVYLTGEGRETFERIWPNLARCYADLFRGISEDELRTLVAILQKVLAGAVAPAQDQPMPPV